jgi:glycosyltransferase involved in cell wall biosynthesis
MTNESAPRVSIGMPVYNAGRFLRAALDSILSQTFEDFELIISDNGSIDSTQEICKEYAAKDARIAYYRNDKNRGASWNYNRVTELAKGVYIKHAAHDDLLAPEYVARCVEVLDREPSVVLCYPRTTFIDEQGNPIGKGENTLDLRSNRPHERFKRYHELINENSMCDPVFGLFRASALKKTPVVASFTGSDMLLLGEMALLGRIYELPEYLFYERWHGGTSVHQFPTLAERAQWFDPSNKGKLWTYVMHWRWLVEYLKAIGRVSMSPYEKLMCYVQMLRWCWLQKRALLTDLVEAAVEIGKRLSNVSCKACARTSSQTAK